MSLFLNTKKVDGGFIEPPQWDDMRFPVVGRNLDTSSGRIDYDYTDLGVRFADNARYAATEQISIIIQMQHDWKLGTEIRPHIHWIQAQAALPNWLLEYRVYDNSETPPATFTPVAVASEVFAYSAGSIVQISIFPAIDMSSITGVSSFVDIKLYRDTGNASGLFAGSDPVSAGVLLKEFDIHYLRDTVGSRMEYAK